MSHPDSSEKKFVITPFIERKWRLSYDRFDHNKDGILSEEDVMLLMDEAKEKQRLTDEQVENMKKLHKVNYAQCVGAAGGVGRVEDLLKACSELTEEQVKNAVTHHYGSLFEAVDTKKNGVLSLDEFLDWMDLANTGRQKGKATFKLIDTDGDGQISREEFMNFVLRFAFSNDESDPSKLFFGPLPPPE